jgi:hypothetical protein
VNERKQKLLETLDAFVNQRPGLDPRDYGDWRGYRRESAAITKDMHDYYAIRSQIAWRDSISADDIIKASERAFSGRLTIAEKQPTDYHGKYSGLIKPAFKLSYCAGQYMPTEYRKAACAVLASAWRAATREDCPIEEDSPGGWMHKQAKATFSRSVQQGYFR